MFEKLLGKSKRQKQDNAFIEENEHNIEEFREVEKYLVTCEKENKILKQKIENDNKLIE